MLFPITKFRGHFEERHLASEAKISWKSVRNNFSVLKYSFLSRGLLLRLWWHKDVPIVISADIFFQHRLFFSIKVIYCRPFALKSNSQSDSSWFVNICYLRKKRMRPKQPYWPFFHKKILLKKLYCHASICPKS